MSDPILRGTVKFWNESKKYGFITPDDGGKDVFVHMRALLGFERLYERDEVEYQLARMQDGRLRAQNCRVVV
jgi:CspA family cold shock protein